MQKLIAVSITPSRQNDDVAAPKVQELNIENTPVIEEFRDRRKPGGQLRRRVVCFIMGKATFTTQDDEVDVESRIRYRLHDDLVFRSEA